MVVAFMRHVLNTNYLKQNDRLNFHNLLIDLIL